MGHFRDTDFKVFQESVSNISKLLYKRRVAIRNRVNDSDWETEFRDLFKNLRKELNNIGTNDQFRGLVEDFIKKVTVKKVMTKIPVPPVNYLEEDVKITDVDIDWILGSLRNQWIRFNQIYWGNWIENEMKNTYN